MISRKDLIILSELRCNARETLTRISKKTQIPVSTIFDKLRYYDGSIIKSHTALLDFGLLGFNTRATIMVKVDRDVRDEVKEFLCKHHNVNSVAKINNGFDYMFESIFFNLKDMEDFMEKFDQRYKILDSRVYYIIEDLKKESFLADPNVIGTVMKDSA